MKELKKDTEKKTEKEKDIILVLGILKSMGETIEEFKNSENANYKFAAIYSSKKPLTDLQKKSLKFFDIKIPCDFHSNESIEKALRPYKDRLLAVTCRAEANIPLFQKLIPNIPYLNTPTTESLEWATNKVQMRKRLRSFEKKISPAFLVVNKSNKETIAKIEEKVSYPLMVKPAGLAASVLVSVCYHREELEQALEKTFRKINGAYKAYEGRGTPQVLVEQFMEGEMYSIDAYVGSTGSVTYCPMVHIKTGFAVGFSDDFFGYRQITPTRLKFENVRAARETAGKAIVALGLRSVTAHVELMRTEDGWKIIELGPRVGGFRDNLYKLSYGFDHGVNDILTRIPGRKPKMYKKVLGHTVAMKFFAKEEGTIVSILGLKKIEKLDSFFDIRVNKKRGDRAVFAKHGGKSIFDLTMFNEDRSQLLADIRRVEKAVIIRVQ